MDIKLNSLADAKALLQNLDVAKLKSDTGWSPYQNFVHCAKTIDYAMTGYPRLKPAWLRQTIGRIAIHKFLKQGYMKHNLTADVEGSPVLPSHGNAQDGLDTLLQSINRFTAWQGAMQPHLLFGNLSKAEYDRYFALHIADHFTALSQA